MIKSSGRSIHFILLILFYFFALLPLFFWFWQVPNPDTLLSAHLSGTPSQNWELRQAMVELYSQWQQQQNRVWLYFIIYVSVVSLLVVAIAYRLTRPLRDLEQQAKAMSEGNWGSAIRKPLTGWLSFREVNHLADALESARLKILHSYQELESQVAERTWDLQVKIHQLSQAEEKIESSNKALAEALARNERQRVLLQDVLDNLPVGAIITRSADADPEYVNQRAAKLLTIRKGGKNYVDRYQLYQADQTTLYTNEALPINHCFQSRHGEYKEDIYARRPDGSFIQLYAQSSVIYDKIGNVELAIMIFDDITARKEVERQKSEFVSVASHQLRTPLSGIKWYMELLQDKRNGKLTAKQKEYSDNILQSTERLISLVNELLNVSRIESRRVAINPEPLDLGKLLRTIREQMTPQWSSREQIIDIHESENIPQIALDPKFMAEAFSNLLSNAIKYSPNGSTIKVALEARPADVLITVRDEGMGIPLSDQSKVFTKFFRADNVVKKETEGSGLGLYVTKRIIEASGGTIRFQSEESKGTTFFVTLPMAGSPHVKGEKTLI